MNASEVSDDRTANEVPPGVVTVISTAPSGPAGEVAVIVVSDTTVNAEAGVSPKSTAVAPVNPVPEMVTAVPPSGEPWLGATLLTVGCGADAPAVFGNVGPSPTTVVATRMMAAAPRRTAKWESLEAPLRG